MKNITYSDIFARNVTCPGLKLPGLDKGRADVIFLGCLTVIRILYFFKSLQIEVSLSVLLEGTSVESSEGGKND
ncbi:MAG: hypothetical protein B1H12_02630 [Desulfobacteraceae bacterium 4484_190.2]|nr:MAG: hypothetical protein B1H12_02630 [Desulfobacteraceae bacterium 4484_190.2]